VNATGASTVTKLIPLLVIPAILLGCGQRTTPPAVGGNSAATPAGSQASSITDKKIHPCSLITKEEAKAALGSRGEVKLVSDDAVCGYSVSAETGVANKADTTSIVVHVVTADSPQFQKFELAADDRTQTQPVSGLGEKALLFFSRDSPDKSPIAIRVLKGKVYFAIAMSSSSEPVQVEVLKALAAKALSRLP
jgi:hypothetical protein